MAKLTTQGYELPPGRYVLEILEVGPTDRPDLVPSWRRNPLVYRECPHAVPLRMRYRVVEGEFAGLEFSDYPSCQVEEGIKVDTPIGTIVEAALDRRLTSNNQFDIDELIGRKVEAMVSVKSGDTRSRTEPGTIGPRLPKKTQPEEGSRVERSEDSEGDELRVNPF